MVCANIYINLARNYPLPPANFSGWIHPLNFALVGRGIGQGAPPYKSQESKCFTDSLFDPKHTHHMSLEKL